MFKNTTKRVFLIDNELNLLGIQHILKELDNVEIYGTSTSHSSACDKIAKLRTPADLIITDINVGEGVRLEYIKNIRHITASKILILSDEQEELYALRALRLKTIGYISKSEPTKAILEKITAALNGEIVLSSKMNTLLLKQIAHQDDVSKTPISLLSNRQLEIFRLLGVGKTTRQIAVSLNLSIKTIEAHRDIMKKKLKITTGNDLVVAAINHVRGTNE
jgi:DNA-binding NarL/FixJ family response regulator